MEKSIENIWKEGFLKSDVLLAPKVNDLYNKKSIHVIDKFKRMFKVNLLLIVVFAVGFLIASIIIGIPVTGIMFFVALSVLLVFNKGLLNDLGKIDKGLSSYQYLKTFNQWVAKLLKVNKKISTFFYPFIFMSFLIGFWFKDAEGLPLGQRLVNEILHGFPDIYLVFGVPLIGIVIAFIIFVGLAIFGGKIYQWDLNVVYGRVFKKIEELQADMERLNA